MVSTLGNMPSNPRLPLAVNLNLTIRVARLETGASKPFDREQ